MIVATDVPGVQDAHTRVSWLSRSLSALGIICILGLVPPLLYKDASRRSSQQRRLNELAAAFQTPVASEDATPDPATIDSPLEFEEPDALSKQWERILSDDCRDARIRWNGITYGLHKSENITVLPAEIVCNDILYTSHPSRKEDRELDEFRQAWSEKQSSNCFFLIKVQKYLNETQVIPAKAARQWRKRTPKSAVGLVDRYRGGLVIMALIGLGRIRTEDGSAPWTLYVDSDTMMVNADKSIGDIVLRVKEAAVRSTVEEEQCFLTPALWQCYDDDDANAYTEAVPSIVLGVSDGCMRGYNTQSGAILFQATALTGFVFELLAKSPEFVIDTKHYQLGDQAIWDWLAERAFRMDWSRLRTICSDTDRRTELLREPCENSQFIFRRDYHGTDYKDGHWLLTHLESRWTGQGSRPLVGNIAWNCVRWFNSPGCPIRRDDSRPFSFRCGDLVWHLYGCAKNSWRHGPLYELLSTPECSDHLPKPLPPPAIFAARKAAEPVSLNLTDEVKL